MYYLLIERSGNAFLLFILFILCFYKKMLIIKENQLISMRQNIKIRKNKNEFFRIQFIIIINTISHFFYFF